MSQQMNQAKETVEKIINSIEAGSHPSKEALLEQLKTIDKLIAQNQSKIWLRTRSGKPMAEKMETGAANALGQLESGSPMDVNELLGVAKEIDEESQRRSMVVT
jgi:hypothetical protein